MILSHLTMIVCIIILCMCASSLSFMTIVVAQRRTCWLSYTRCACVTCVEGLRTHARSTWLIRTLLFAVCRQRTKYDGRNAHARRIEEIKALMNSSTCMLATCTIESLIQPVCMCSHVPCLFQTSASRINYDLLVDRETKGHDKNGNRL
jgi:hypothetical protein